MNKLHFSTMFCGVTFGLLASLSAVQATEVDDVVPSRLGDDVSAQAGYYDDWWTSQAPQGPQGPIRSDLIEANSSDSDYDANVKAMEILVSQENP
jgi:hypothetical protein